VGRLRRGATDCRDARPRKRADAPVGQELVRGPSVFLRHAHAVSRGECCFPCKAAVLSGLLLFVQSGDSPCAGCGGSVR
jgi:hypothetical protein